MQNTKPTDYPQAVLKQIELLAENIVIARKRRQETQAQWAKKLGVSQPTMARIERGDPSVAMASYVMCMWLINQATGLADVIAPQKDHASLEREISKARSSGVSVVPASSVKLGVSAAQKPASQFGGSTPAQFAAQRGVSPVATQHAKTAAGLAALLAKTEAKSK